MEKPALEWTSIYEGKAKILFETGDRDTIVQRFKNDATAFNALKKGSIPNKGAINCQLSAHLFGLLEAQDVRTHFVDRLSPTDMKVRRLKMVGLEVVMRNRIAGSLVKRLGQPEGTPLAHPILEWYYKRDDLGDPIVNRDHIDILRLATDDVIATIEKMARRINDILLPYFSQKGILLVDMKFEFGTDDTGTVLLGDEISGDTCRFWDSLTHDKMDKDRFRQDLGKIEENYLALFRRVTQHEPEL
ncbi:MAG: phosphoribosylaminoimidazolesuccinocarboxamide synthase [Leptospirales bacterium]